MTRAQVVGFDWAFIDEVSRWALAVTVVVSLAGIAVTGNVWFAVACVVAAGIDLALVAVSVRRARRELELGHIDTVAPIVMLAGRLMVKAVVLLVAFFAPQSGVFAGAVAGVLVFDVTLAFGGSAIALSRGMRRPQEGGDGRA